MADLTDLVFGVLLWLGSGAFLITLFNSKAESKNNHPSGSLTKSKSVTNPSSNKSSSPPENIEIKKLQQALTENVEALTMAREEIAALKSELELTSDALESNQDKYYRLNQDLTKQIEQLTEQIGRLNRKNAQLDQEYQNLPSQIGEENFEQLQALLTNYPTAKMMIKFKPDLPAKNVISLLKPLDNFLSYWQISPIGQPWQKVKFDPQFHQPDSDDINEGDFVYIRFVGYSRDNNVLAKAKVSRFLPGKVKSDS